MKCIVFSIIFTVFPLQTSLESAQEGDPKAPLRLVLSTTKETLDTSALIAFKIQFTNTTEAPLELRLNPELPGRAIVYLESPDGKMWRPITLNPAARSPAVRCELKSGESTQSTGCYSLCFLRGEAGDGQFALPAKGKWKMWATYRIAGATVKSNIITMLVKHDENLAAPARELFGGVEWHTFAMGGSANEEHIAKFRAFVELGAAAPQRDLMAYQLGIRDINAARHREASVMFQAALDAGAGNIDRVEATLLLASCLVSMKELRLALSKLDQIITEATGVDRSKVEDMRARIKELLKE